MSDPSDLSQMPDLTESLQKILASENVASRLPIFENYDKVVQGQTVIEPGMADAGLVAPFRNREDAPELHKIGAALSVDANPRYGRISPYWCAVNAVVESMRNVAAVGATPWAATDCLNFGNPEKPEQMWELVESIRGIKDALEGVGHLAYPGHPLPIISGNVSLYNESPKGSVAPSPVIGMLGRIENHEKAINMELKAAGSKLFLLGDRKNELGGSEYYRAHGHLGANVPEPNFEEVRKELQAVLRAIDEGLILAAHDISDGGLAVTLAEMAFGGRGEGTFSVRVDLSAVGLSDRTGEIPLRTDQKLFSETGGFVLELPSEKTDRFQEICREIGLTPFEIGEVTDSDDFEITTLKVSKAKLLDIWLNSLRNLLNS